MTSPKRFWATLGAVLIFCVAATITGLGGEAHRWRAIYEYAKAYQMIEYAGQKLVYDPVLDKVVASTKGEQE